MTNTLGIERHHIAGEPIPHMTPKDWSRPIQVVDTTTGKRMAALVADGPDEDGDYSVQVEEPHVGPWGSSEEGACWAFKPNGAPWSRESILRVVPAKPDANAEPAVHSIGGIGALEPLWDDERAPRLPTETEWLRAWDKPYGHEFLESVRDRNLIASNPIRDFAEQHKHLSGEALLRAWEDAR